MIDSARLNSADRFTPDLPKLGMILRLLRHISGEVLDVDCGEHFAEPLKAK